MKKRTHVYLISDATGDLGERFLHAVFTQFPKKTFALTVFNFIKNKRALARCCKQIIPENAILFHATIFEQLKEEIERFAKEQRIPCTDLTGPAMTFLVKASHIKPEPSVQKFHEVDAEYIERISSLEFTLSHDDGLRVDSINNADIILVGVSRTCKTPTSMLLATKGYKVANVPLVLGLPVPRELKRIRNKVVGLTIDPQRLSLIRKKRVLGYHSQEGTYADIEAIKAEVEEAERLFAMHGWPVVNVTNHAIEENAALVLKAVTASN